MTKLRVLLACGTALALATGCTYGQGGSSGYGDGDGDADSDADADVDEGPASGVVLGEAVGGTRPPLAGIRVELLDAAGETLAEAETDATGAYEIAALPGEAEFIVAHPTNGYVGQLRSSGIREGAQFYELTLQSQSGIERRQGEVGLTADPSRGLVVVGFNPVDPEAGGEGATLDPANHDAPFTLVDDTAMAGNVLPPTCSPAGVGEDCVQGTRGDFVFFPNVDPGFVRLRLIQPDGGTCAQRFDVDRWLSLAGVSTIIEVDCLAD